MPTPTYEGPGGRVCLPPRTKALQDGYAHLVLQMLPPPPPPACLQNCYSIHAAVAAAPPLPSTPLAMRMCAAWRGGYVCCLGVGMAAA